MKRKIRFPEQGRLLRADRYSRKMTQAEYAWLLEMDINRLARLECGLLEVRMGEAQRILKITGVNLWEVPYEKRKTSKTQDLIEERNPAAFP